MPRKSNKPIQYDPAAPIQKVKGESWKANTALKDYYLMGGSRSLRKLLSIYKKQAISKDTAKKGDRDPPPTNSINTINSWSKRNRWQERVIDQAAIDTNTDLAKWAQRRDEIREEDYKAGKKIRGLAIEILEHTPEYIIKKEFSKRGSDIITIIKALDGHLMLKAFDIASNLQRVSADMATENITINPDGESINKIAERLKRDLLGRIKSELEEAPARTKTKPNK